MEMGDEGQDALAWNFVKKEYPDAAPDVCIAIFYRGSYITDIALVTDLLAG